MRLKFLLRPSWLALTLAVFVFAGSCYTLLAPWQFERHAARQAQNEALQRSISAEPKPLADVLPGQTPPNGRTQWTPVKITGEYLPDAEVIARLRTVHGEPAYEVLTPLRATSGSTVLINRGYLRPDERVRVPDYAAPPEGEVTVVARARLDEVDTRQRPVFADESTGGKPHTYSVNSQLVARAAGLDIRPGYFQLTPAQPGVLDPLPLPRTEAGPFLSYALQWIAFGTMALLGWLYFSVRELRPGGALHDEGRRKSVAEMLAEDEAEPPAASRDDARATSRNRQPTRPS